MRELTPPADICTQICYVIYNIYTYLLNLVCIVCREGQLTHLFFPGRVGRGYGPDWTLVVSPAPIGWLVGLDEKSIFGTEKTPEGAPRYWWLALSQSLWFFQKVDFWDGKNPRRARPSIGG